jgi:hypothetical protein
MLIISKINLKIAFIYGIENIKTIHIPKSLLFVVFKDL